jgi:hypothetical protein
VIRTHWEALVTLVGLFSGRDIARSGSRRCATGPPVKVWSPARPAARFTLEISLRLAALHTTTSLGARSLARYAWLCCFRWMQHFAKLDMSFFCLAFRIKDLGRPAHSLLSVPSFSLAHTAI